MTYMASCGDTTCDKFNGSDAQWFKIDEAGKKSGDSSTWIQQDIMNGDSFTVTLPQDLSPGDYLIRHEVSITVYTISCPVSDVYARSDHRSPPRRDQRRR